ncbi:MAG TPA: HDOD domain-containing protein [Terriglobia bacterium]|nr:HDOD domain-containing protein [Terriglobia bacterium]
MKVSKITSICEGIAERDMVALYNSAPIKQFKAGEHILAGVERSDSHFLVLDGKVAVFRGTETPHEAGISFGTGHCIGPMMAEAETRLWIQAAEPATVIELKPGILACLPDKLQIWIYKNASRPGEQCSGRPSSPKSNANFEDRYNKLAAYIRYQRTRNAEIVASEFVREFVNEIPKLPAHTTELSQKLLEETTSVQEIVESIKRDPALAGNILKTVNSAKYSFNKKIETFYHACMILGFGNIYQLVMQESIKNSISATPESQEIQFHSCLVSALCYEVASISRDVHPQTAMTVGLLHDLGKNVVVLLKQKHPAVSGFARMLDTAKLGADLVRHWGLPDHLCQTIESQNEPEFLPPDAINVAVRKEVAVLHFAHLLEGVVTGKPVDASVQPFNKEYFEVLGIPPADISEIYQTKILPALMRNKQRLSAEIRQLLQPRVGAGV